METSSFTDNGLNPAQRRAVGSDAQSLLITAGPGSGKTHTLICRIIHTIRSLKPGQKVLAITFTHKAADEMRRRLSAQIPDFEQAAFIGTCHQACFLFLRQYSGMDRSIASDAQCLAAAQTLWPGITPSERKKRLQEISWGKCVDFLSEPSAVAREFDQALAREGLCDFDGLLHGAFFLLKENSAVLSDLQMIYTDIFVDEFQDMNPIQYALLKLLTGSSGKISAIGDPDQAIYGFRGSSADMFHRFAADFNGVEAVRLSTNYRNAPNVIAASSQVMKKEALAETPPRIVQIYGAGHLTVHEAATDRAEAEYIVHTIEKLIGGTSLFSQDSGRVGQGDGRELSFGDIAVLYRLKSQSRELRRAFTRSGMPFHVSGGEEEAAGLDDDLFSQRTPIQDVEAEKVMLMTLHASKGLEFACVFMCGCEDGILPLNLMKMTADQAEERRLFYVGMTRAGRFLYLTHASRRMLYGQTWHLSVSPFVRDIEASLKEVSSQQMFRKKKAPADDGQMELF